MLNGESADKIQRLEQQLASMRVSNSWRVTAPLRWAGLFLSRQLRFLSSEREPIDAPLPDIKLDVHHVDLQPSIDPLHGRLAKLSKGQHRVAYFAENVHSSTFRYRAANMAEVLNAPTAAGSSETLPTSAACFFADDVIHAAQIASNANILVISRARYDSGLAVLIQHFKKLGKKVWFDLDDWLVDTADIELIINSSGQSATDDTLNYWYAVVGRMSQALRLCDGAITTNDYLAQKISKFTSLPVKVIPNFSNEQQLAASQSLYQKKTDQLGFASKSIKLGYFSGSASHNRDIALLFPALEIVMAGDPRVELVLVGPVELGEQAARFEQIYSQRITRHAFTDYVYLQQLIADVDFNLVPLQINEFTHCKSELKYVDAANVGTLTIASPTHAYFSAIRHGENGYIAADHEWETVLLQAIAIRDTDFEQHRRMLAAAFQDVQQRFTWKTQRPAILQALELDQR